MTTVVAAKKGKKICIGCDSLTIFGKRKERVGLLSNKEGKVIKFGSTYLAFSGHAVWHEVLGDYFKNFVAKEKLSNVNSIYSEMIRFHRVLKEKYFLAPQQNKNDIFESSECMFLLANPYGIFEVDWMRNVREFSKIAAIGTGDEYALGAMKAIYNLEDSPRKIVQKGLEIAAKFDKKTELPGFYYSLDISQG